MKRGTFGGPEARRAIGERLRQARKRRGIKQVEIGRVLGVTSQQVSKYEKGINDLPLTAAVVLRKKFGITLHELAPAPPDATAAILVETMRALERLLDHVRRMR